MTREEILAGSTPRPLQNLKNTNSRSQSIRNPRVKNAGVPRKKKEIRSTIPDLNRLPGEENQLDKKTDLYTKEEKD